MTITTTTIPPSNEPQQQPQQLAVSGVSHATRRRNRDYQPSSVEQAKQQFRSAVEGAIENLITNCGYSRSRAVSALVHEFRREISTPSDDKVFEAMQRYGLGIEDATRALIVSAAMRRAVKENGGSLMEAIDDLTEKLSMTNTRAMSDSTDFSDVEERPRSPDRRVETVSNTERPSSVSSRRQQTSGSSRKSKAASKNAKTKSSSTLSSLSSSKSAPAKGGSTPKPATRKRLIDEANNQADKKVILREIPDPARDDVDAQVAMKCKEDDGSLPDTTNTTTALRTASASVVPRAKRTHRAVEDGAATSQSSALKRARTSEA